MKRTDTLPETYEELMTIDLQQNKKQFIIVNGLSIVIAIVLMVIGFMWRNSVVVFEEWWMWLVTGAAIVVYTILHELVHGITMKIVGTPKVKYGYTGLYAFAGSDDYYTKVPYISIALAPVVLFGILFGVLAFLVPIQWFWVVWFLQIVNIGGAAGDFYVTYKMCTLPKNILIKDVGTSMRVYTQI